MSVVVFRGAAIHSLNLTTLELLDDATLVITDGRLTNFWKTAQDIPKDAVPSDAKIYTLPYGEFLIPGFVDTHNHAPQWPMRGLGQGLHILDWLNDVTFPVEARFSDPDYAKRMYQDTVQDFLRQGITTAS